MLQNRSLTWTTSALDQEKPEHSGDLVEGHDPAILTVTTEFHRAGSVIPRPFSEAGGPCL